MSSGLCGGQSPSLAVEFRRGPLAGADTQALAAMGYEKTRANRSRILGRFGDRKAESEITVKKLGAKFAQTPTKVEKRASVFSL